MTHGKHVYGVVASRRLGKSLGVGPITDNMCNFGCVYCQLGRSDYVPHVRKNFTPVKDILAEFDEALQKAPEFDVVSIVGDGEPTLNTGLGKLIKGIKARTDKPVVLITNGSLFFDPETREEAAQADIVIPSLDAYDEPSFKRINRPYNGLTFEEHFWGIVDFSKRFEGQLWLEIIFMKGLNDSEDAMRSFEKLLEAIRYDKLYLNTPVRPPTESYAQPVDATTMKRIQKTLGGIPLDYLSKDDYMSDIDDSVEALKALIKRHPMHQFEIEGFLRHRRENPKKAIEALQEDKNIEIVSYHNYDVYRFKH